MYYFLYNGYSPLGDVFLIFMSVIFLIIANATYIRRTVTANIFVSATIMMGVACAANILGHQGAVHEWDIRLILALFDVFNGALLTLMALFELYLASMSSYDKRTFITTGIVSGITNFAGMLLIVMSPLTGWGRHIKNGVWVDPIWNSPFMCFYIINVLYMLVVLLVKRKFFIERVRNIMVITEIMAVGLFMLGNILAKDMVTVLSFSFPITVVLILLHSNSYDVESGTFDSKTFDIYLHEIASKGTVDYLLCIKFYVDDDFVLPRKLGMVFYNFFSRYVKRSCMFNPTNDSYVLAVDSGINKNVEEALDLMINQEFPKYYREFDIDYKIVVMTSENITNLSQFKHVFHFMRDKIGVNEVKYASTEDQEAFIRNRHILLQLTEIARKGDMDDPRVLAFCQPVYNVHRKCFDTGEALMRLRIPELGYISPVEFIPLAESSGCIHTLSLIMLNKVCRHIRKMMDEGVSFDRISVNFSMEELDDPNFMDEYREIMTRYGIPYDKLGVELTESSNDADYDNVKDIVSAFKELGTPLYLDDFGTGYSNFDRILSLGFDVIKFDRSLLLLTDDRVDMREMINSFSMYFSEMGYTILYEGVETEAQENTCITSHADYLQGFRYAKPVPIEELNGYFEQGTPVLAEERKGK